MSNKLEDVKLSKYCQFNIDNGKFYLSNEAQEIIYRQKNVICSYSGSNDWCNHFMCESIDLFSGSNQYNYALGSTVHEKRIEELYKDKANKQSIIDWVKDFTKNEWSIAMLKMFDDIIDNLVEI